MQERYNAFMASRYLFTAASSSMGTADTARAGESSPASAAVASPSAAAVGWGNALPFGEPTYRSTGGEGGFEVPTMTAGDAAQVTRGFMAIGRVRDVVKALGKALQAIGAEVGPSFFSQGRAAARTSFFSQGRAAARNPPFEVHRGFV